MKPLLFALLFSVAGLCAGCETPEGGAHNQPVRYQPVNGGAPWWGTRDDRARATDPRLQRPIERDNNLMPGQQPP